MQAGMLAQREISQSSLLVGITNQSTFLDSMHSLHIYDTKYSTLDVCYAVGLHFVGWAQTGKYARILHQSASLWIAKDGAAIQPCRMSHAAWATYPHATWEVC